MSTNQVNYQQVARFAANTDRFGVLKPKLKDVAARLPRRQDRPWRRLSERSPIYLSGSFFLVISSS
jgi:hypothetical protein